MRKPVLGWKEVKDSRGTFYKIDNPVRDGDISVWDSREGQWQRSNHEGLIVLIDYQTADAAMLACEDHLFSLLEPLAKTIELLKENREK